jgi:lanosterol synthase
MWMSEEGMMMNGTNGSQLWDTAFIVQALAEGSMVNSKLGLIDEISFRPMILNCMKFLDETQVFTNPLHYKEANRHLSKGSWPFSTKLHGYSVSDCTAEGLKCFLNVKDKSCSISEERMYEAVNVLLSLQNSDGGFSGYESIRGPTWLELFNPSQVFKNIMIETNFVECTASAILSLISFQKQFPCHRKQEITRSIRAGVQYIKSEQRNDGSWYGGWGICFTYGTYFGLEGLAAVGETYAKSAEVKRACDFLVAHQMPDGGWGESYKSCQAGKFIFHEKSQVVQTAWATLGLLAAEYPERSVIDKAVQVTHF